MGARKLFAGPHDRRIKRALCIVAHPDDIEFYCAGCVLVMTDRGVAVDFVVATSGDKGGREPGLTSAALARRREGEQEAAAKRLGAGRVTFLRHPDAEVVDTLEFRARLVAEIRASKPDLLLTFDPTPGYRQHPDHRVTGRVALDAAWPCARDALSFPDRGAPHETAEAWCFAGPAPDLIVDVSSVVERKIEARLEHASQTGSAASLRQRWRRIGAEEWFKQVDLR